MEAKGTYSLDNEANFTRLLIEFDGETPPQWLRELIERVTTHQLQSLPSTDVERIYGIIDNLPERNSEEDITIRRLINHCNVIIRCKASNTNKSDYDLSCKPPALGITEALEEYRNAHEAASFLHKPSVTFFFKNKRFHHLLVENDSKVNCANQHKLLRSFSFNKFNLRDATFYGSVIAKSKFIDAGLFNTNLIDTNVEHAEITWMQLASADCDYSTQCGSCTKMANRLSKAIIHRGLKKHIDDLIKKDSASALDPKGRISKKWIEEKILAHPDIKDRPDKNLILNEHIQFLKYLQNIAQTSDTLGANGANLNF